MLRTGGGRRTLRAPPFHHFFLCLPSLALQPQPPRNDPHDYHILPFPTFLDLSLLCVCNPGLERERAGLPPRLKKQESRFDNKNRRPDVCFGPPFTSRFPPSLLPATPTTMARTMGEVLPPSFPALFALAPRAPATNRRADADDDDAAPTGPLFVDVGSGYGTLCVAAVAEYGFGAAVGIEKYRCVCVWGWNRASGGRDDDDGWPSLTHHHPLTANPSSGVTPCWPPWTPPCAPASPSTTLTWQTVS